MLDIGTKARELADQTEHLSAEALLKQVLTCFGERIALSSSFSVEDQVLTDMLCQLSEKPKVFTLDTGRLPQETFTLMDDTRRRYDIDIEILFPDTVAVEEMVAEYGPNLFYESIELRKECCRVRKIQPLKRGLAALDAWVCGLRREQSTTRSDLERVQADQSFGLIKISPLADWTTEQVWDYVRSHDVPYNTLHDRGYPSIGCAPCTRAVERGEDVRGGRWWWEAPEHKECGLHLRPDGSLGPAKEGQ